MDWVVGPLRAFFPFQQAFLCHGELVAGQIRVTHWKSVGHGPAYLEQLATTFELRQRGSLGWWLANRQPFAIDPHHPPPYSTTFEIEEIQAFSLRSIAAHGIINVKASAGTYFSFAGVGTPSAWHIDALRLIAPVLNDLLLGYVATQQAQALQKGLAVLTPSQTTIVRHIVAGADDKSIARSLGIAEKTVRNQLTRAYAILGVHKRSQLIALLR